MASATSSPDPQSWQVDKTLSSCLLHVLENELSCDVTFLIQSQTGAVERVSAHKLILQARSPVFEAMFSGDFSENRREVLVSDVQLGPFRQTLRYMYSDEVTLTGDNALHVLYAAKKYRLGGLVKRCGEYLEKELSTENVCGILSQACEYQEESLVNSCLEYIAPKVKDVSKTEGFFNMSSDALLKVLRCPYILSGVEVELFRRCCGWVNRSLGTDASETEVRTLLGDCRFQIRYHEMTAEQFAREVTESHFLTGDEKSLFLSLLVIKEERLLVKLSELGFNIEPRMTQLGRYSRVNPTHFAISCASPGKEEKFNLTPNNELSVVGFGIFGGQNQSEHTVHVTVTSPDTQMVQVKKVIKSDGSGQPIPVCIPKTPLQPFVTYTVTVNVEGPNPVGYGERRTTSLQSKQTIIVNTQQIVNPWSRPNRTAHGGFVPSVLVISW